MTADSASRQPPTTTDATAASDARVDGELRERVDAWLSDRPHAPSAIVQRALGVATAKAGAHDGGASQASERILGLPARSARAAAAVLGFALLSGAIAFAIAPGLHDGARDRGPNNAVAGDNARQPAAGSVNRDNGNRGNPADSVAANNDSNDRNDHDDHNTSVPPPDNNDSNNPNGTNLNGNGGNTNSPIDRPDRQRMAYDGPHPLTSAGATHALLRAFAPLANLELPRRARALAELMQAHTLEVTFQRGRGITSLLLTRPVGVGRPLPMTPIIMTVFPEAMYLQLRVSESADPVITLLAAPKSVF